MLPPRFAENRASCVPQTHEGALRVRAAVRWGHLRSNWNALHVAICAQTRTAARCRMSHIRTRNCAQTRTPRSAVALGRWGFALKLERSSHVSNCAQTGTHLGPSLAMYVSYCGTYRYSTPVGAYCLPIELRSNWNAHAAQGFALKLERGRPPANPGSALFEELQGSTSRLRSIWNASSTGLALQPERTLPFRIRQWSRRSICLRSNWNADPRPGFALKLERGYVSSISGHNRFQELTLGHPLPHSPSKTPIARKQERIVRQAGRPMPCLLSAVGPQLRSNWNAPMCSPPNWLRQQAVTP